MKKALNTLCCTLLTALALTGQSAMADQTISDDLVVKGSICVGFDCSTGESFGYDTIRMKENNLRIRFQDTSASASFPTRDWQITANDSTNGGLNNFKIENIDGETIPFTIIDGAINNALYISTLNRIGLGITNPQMNIHILTGNSPTIRLEQDQSNGFSAQAWDLSANETNFFIRDVTSGGTLPLRIRVGAPNNAFYIAGDGDVGLETTTPDGMFDIAHPSDQNNHAILVSPLGYLGVNIDNSFVPNGLLDVQTTGGISRFLVKTDGNVGIGTTAPDGRFDIKGLDSTTNYFNIDANGKIGVGTVAPNAQVEVNSGDVLVRNGQVRVGELLTTANAFGLTSLIHTKSAATAHNLLTMDTTDANTVSELVFMSASTPKWIFSSRNSYPDGTSTLDRFNLYNAAQQEVFTLHQNGSMFIGTGAANNNTSHALEAASGAHLTTGGVWTSVSSREAKQDIEAISVQQAESTLADLEPVTFKYKKEPEETYAGFIAEDVPEFVATNSKKALVSMDIVAVLTKVVQQQQKTIRELNVRLKKLETEK